VLRLREAHPKRLRNEVASYQAAYIAMALSPTALSLGNLNQSLTPAWARNTLHVGSSTSQTLRRGAMDESAEHILATSADFFERFQSPAAIGV
jgi:hypothetical protein